MANALKYGAEETGKGISKWGQKFMGVGSYKPQKITYEPSTVNEGRQVDVRGDQGELEKALRYRMLGQGPSVAEQQMKAGMGQAMAQGQSYAASARGGNQGLATRMGGQMASNAAAQANRDAGMLRAQEMQTAGQTYAQQLQAKRAADLQARGYDIDTAGAQLNAEVQRQQMKTQMAEGNAERGQKGAGLFGAVFSSDIRAKEDITPLYSDFTTKEQMQPPQQSFGQALQGAMGTLAQGGQPMEDPMAKLAAENEQKRNAFKAAADAQQAAAKTGKKKGGGGGGIIGTVMGLLSDFKSKDIADQHHEAYAPVKPVNYRYKPEHAARMASELTDNPDQQLAAYFEKRTPRNGIIAQDMEKSPAFEDSVINTPVGKALDRDRMLSEVMAQEAGVDKRLSDIEQKLSKRMKAKRS